MVSTEEALKKMEDRAKKKKKSQPTTSAGSPFSRPPRRTEKRKETNPIVGQQKEKRIREKIDIDVESISIDFLPKTSLWKNPKAFASVLPHLVFEEDKPIYEKVREIGVLEHTAQVALQVSDSTFIPYFENFCSKIRTCLSFLERGGFDLAKGEE